MPSSMLVHDRFTRDKTGMQRHRAGSLRIRIPPNDTAEAKQRRWQTSHIHPNANTLPSDNSDDAISSLEKATSPVIGAKISNLEDLQYLPDTFARQPTGHVPQSSKPAAKTVPQPRRLDWRFAKDDDFNDIGVSRVDSDQPRNDSGVIVSPHFESRTEQPQPETRDRDDRKPQKKSGQRRRYRKKLGDAFHVALDIYEAGPPGEGHELWRLLRKDEHANSKATRAKTPRSHNVKHRVVGYVQKQKKHVHNAGITESQRSQNRSSSSQSPRLAKSDFSLNKSKNHIIGDTGLSFNSPSTASEKSNRIAQVMNTNKPLPELLMPKFSWRPKPERPKPPGDSYDIVPNSASRLVNNNLQRKPKRQVKPDKSSGWRKLLQKDEKPKTHEEKKRQISRPIYHEPHEVSYNPVTDVIKDRRRADPRPVDPKVNKPLPGLPRCPTRGQKGKQQAQIQSSTSISRLRDRIVHTVGSEGKSSAYSFFSGRSRADSDVSMVCIGISNSAQLESHRFVRDSGPLKQGPGSDTGHSGDVWRPPKHLGAGEGIGDWEDGRYSCGYIDLLEEYYET